VLLANIDNKVFGVMLIYQTSQPGKSLGNAVADLDLGYLFYIISPSLNVLLTLMIVLRIIQHIRNARTALGNSNKVTEEFDIVFIFIEPCALYTVIFLLYVIPWGSGSFVGDIFFPMFVQVQVCISSPFTCALQCDRCDEQVIAPLLVILELAQWPLLTGEETTTTLELMSFLSQGDSVDP
jgi:hypothetical protein